MEANKMILKTLKAQDIYWDDFTHFRLTNTGYTILLKNKKFIGKIKDNEYLKLQKENDWRYIPGYVK